ncbi:MAG: hypothetical protein ACOYNR_15265, partial [Blastocatellia bacterium]
SLTVAELGSDTFTIWIIPHTRKATNLGALAAGDEVNFECDILAKYAERILAPLYGGGEAPIVRYTWSSPSTIQTLIRHSVKDF